MENKKRLIDADALMEQVKAIHRAVDTSGINRDYDTGFHSATSQIQGLIEYMPTIDAVEVVRCRDCKYIRPMIDAVTGEEDGYYCALNLGEVGFDDFCSNGERKEKDA